MTVDFWTKHPEAKILAYVDWTASAGAGSVSQVLSVDVSGSASLTATLSSIEGLLTYFWLEGGEDNMAASVKINVLTAGGERLVAEVPVRSS